MKKLLIFILCLTLLLFCGCRKNTDDPVSGLPDTGTGEVTDGEEEEINVMYVTVNGNKLKVTLEDNSAVAALLEILAEGDIVFTAYGNGGFEIYGDIGHDLPTQDEQIKAQAGDVLLYVGNNICIFYDSNSWSYTRIGKINGYTAAELKNLIGGGTVQVTLSLK